MPKPMTMTIEVEEVAFGRVFRLLDTTQGVASIKIHGSVPKPQSAKTAKANGSNGTVTQIVLAALAHNPMPKDALETVVTNRGKRAASLPDALQKLRRQKLIAGGGRGGVYMLTKAGQTAAKKEEE